jgi:hypothetical protein
MKALYEMADQHRAVSLAGRGTDFTRGLIALALNGGDPSNAAAYARERWGAKSRAVAVTKAAIDAVGSSSEGVSDEGAAAEFFANVMAGSIIGKLSGIRRVPLRSRTLTVSGAISYWIGEGRQKLLSPAIYDSNAMSPMKVASLTVVTRELLEDRSLQAEATIRADLMRVTAEALDVAFIDPANGGLPDIKPASITNGVQAVSGNLRDVVADFEGDLASAYWITSPYAAAVAAGADNPDVGARGGAILGIPTITSRSVPDGVWTLLDPTGIALAEGAAFGRVVTQGDVFMADTEAMAAIEPGSPSGPIAAQVVSLWQTGAVALLAERVMNWSRVRAGSVSLLQQGSP